MTILFVYCGLKRSTNPFSELLSNSRFSNQDINRGISNLKKDKLSFLYPFCLIAHDHCFGKKVGLMHLQKISTHVSLRNPHRLTWVDTFCNTWISWLSKDNSNMARKFGSIHTVQRIGFTHSHTMAPFDAPGKQASWKLSFSHSVFYIFE